MARSCTCDSTSDRTNPSRNPPRSDPVGPHGPEGGIRGPRHPRIPDHRPHPFGRQGEPRNRETMMDRVIRDLRIAARRLRKKPLFTLIAVLSLAIGIGANTAIFSLTNAIILRDLPLEKPEELVDLYRNMANFSHGPFSYPDLRDLERDTEDVFVGSGLVQALPHTNGHRQRCGDGLRRAGEWRLLLSARRGCPSRPYDRPRGRHLPRRPPGGGARLRLLAATLRGRSNRHRTGDPAQRTDVQHHRGGPGGVHGQHPRHHTGPVRVDDDGRPPPTGWRERARAAAQLQPVGKSSVGPGCLPGSGPGGNGPDRRDVQAERSQWVAGDQ